MRTSSGGRSRAAQRTNLRVLGVDRGAHSLVISSAVASEGKTLIVANLGVAFAQAGYRVILVDADLRQPKLAEVLGLSSTVGLTDVLVDMTPVEVALQTWRHGFPLEVLVSGSQPPPNPSELLSSERFASVLGLLTNRVDVVILDAPALLPVTTAASQTSAGLRPTCRSTCAQGRDEPGPGSGCRLPPRLWCRYTVSSTHLIGRTMMSRTESPRRYRFTLCGSCPRIAPRIAARREFGRLTR
jgi:capsular exopolysaccharide synthesis family protein